MASILFIISSAVAFGGTNFISKLMDHGKKEYNRHNLAEEKIQKEKNK